MEITQERIMDLWHKVGAGAATQAEAIEWYQYVSRGDETPVMAGQIWRHKNTRDLWRVIANTNRYGQVIIGRLEWPTTDTPDLHHFTHSFEYVKSAADPS